MQKTMVDVLNHVTGANGVNGGLKGPAPVVQSDTSAVLQDQAVQGAANAAPAPLAPNAAAPSFHKHEHLNALWDTLVNNIPGLDKTWFYLGKDAMAKTPAFKEAARRYGELCQLTYNVYRPEKLSEEAVSAAQTPTHTAKPLNKTVALPLPRLFKPHPVEGQAFTSDHGYLEPDSLVIKAGYQGTKYLYAAAGVLDEGETTGRKGFTKWIGFVAYSQELQEVVVAFRGTQDQDEWAQNADFRACAAFTRIPGLDPSIRAHNGYMESYYDDSVMDVPLVDQVKEGILQCWKTAQSQGWQPKVLSFTGHSLGGAMATVSAFDVVHRKELLDVWTELPQCIQGITYAQPTVGNGAYKKEFERKIPTKRWIRIVNKGDIVPMLPYATISWVSAKSDSFFEKKLYGDEVPANPKKMVPRQVVAQTAAAVKCNPDVKDIYRHVGWELRFVPDNYPYVDVHRFYGLAKWVAYLPTQIVRGFWSIAYKPVLALLAGQWFTSLDNLKEPIYFEKPAERHTLELYIHMVDPSADKMRLNRGDEILIPSALPEDERKALGKVKVGWWNPWPLTDAARPIVNDGMVLTQDASTGNWLWRFKETAAAAQ